MYHVRSFKWRVVNCDEKHDFICSMFDMNCPHGFEHRHWLTEGPAMVSKSCFKATEMSGLEDVARGKRSG